MGNIDQTITMKRACGHVTSGFYSVKDTDDEQVLREALRTTKCLDCVPRS